MGADRPIAPMCARCEKPMEHDPPKNPVLAAMVDEWGRPTEEFRRMVDANPDREVQTLAWICRSCDARTFDISFSTRCGCNACRITLPSMAAATMADVLDATRKGPFAIKIQLSTTPDSSG